MNRLEGVRQVAHGVACEGIGCEVLVPVRNETSRPPGFYIKAERVTSSGNRYASEELFFHDKECMLHTLHWSWSALTDQPLGKAEE